MLNSFGSLALNTFVSKKNCRSRVCLPVEPVCALEIRQALHLMNINKDIMMRIPTGFV